MGPPIGISYGPQTPNSSLAAYVDAPTFFGFYQYTIAADMLKFNTSDPRPSYLAMIDPNNPAAQRLLRFLNVGAGEIEAACGVAARYTPLTLNALAGVSQTILQRLNAARGMWAMMQKLKPGTARPDDVPYVVESVQLLKDLRAGEMIFSTYQSQEAGLASVQPPQPNQLLTGWIVGRAGRLFPSYGPRGLNSGRGFGGGDN